MLDSNLFTRCNNYAILREATSETYGPRVYLISYKLSIYFYLHLYFSNLYYKIPKNIFILSYYLYQISLSQVAVKGLTTPLLRWVQVVHCLCRYSVTCALSPTGLIPWFSKLREILTLLCCITLSSSREKPTQAQEVARRISGTVAGEAYAKSSQDLISQHLAISGVVVPHVAGWVSG